MTQTGGSVPEGERLDMSQKLGQEAVVREAPRPHWVLGIPRCCLSSGEQEAFSNQAAVRATAVTQRNEDERRGTSERALGK